jgi:uroporphyrinogen III methyltransferase / synthase
VRPPLSGRTIVVTRTRDQAGGFAALLRKSGARVVEIPAIEIVPTDAGELDRRLARLDRYDWVLFTSPNGAAIFFRRYRETGCTVPLPSICSIGPATSAQVEAAGFHVELQPRVYQAEGVLEEFRTRCPSNLEGTRILLPRARVAREVLPETLERWGAEVDVVPVYDTVVPEESRDMVRRVLAEGKPDLIAFTSSSTVRNFLELSEGWEALKEIPCAVIGPITGDTARERGFQVVCRPAKATIVDLASAIEDYFRRPRAPSGE